MYKILKAEKLADKIYLMDVHAPRVASHCQPGQFVIVKMDEKGERIPLTICDYDREAGTITIVVQEVGASTVKMSALKEGVPFDDYVEKSEVLEEAAAPVTVTPARIRRMESRSIRTANGIEVKIPTELLNSDSELEFLHDPDGSVSLLIKNVIL